MIRCSYLIARCEGKLGIANKKSSQNLKSFFRTRPRSSNEFFFWEFSHRPKFKKFHTYMQDAIVTANFIEDLPKSRLQAEANST